MLTIGMWVTRQNGYQLGYITNTDEVLFCVRWVRENGRRMKGIAWVAEELLTPAPMELTQEDIKALQHLAVETGDKNWFVELSAYQKN